MEERNDSLEQPSSAEKPAVLSSPGGRGIIGWTLGRVSQVSDRQDWAQV